MAIETRLSRGVPSQTVIDGDRFPWIRKGATHQMGIAIFNNGDLQCIVGSTIRTHPTFLDHARKLTSEESAKANARFSLEIARILEGENTRRVGTISHKDGSKPNIHTALIGEACNPNSLNLYYTKTELNGTTAVYLIAIARLRNSGAIEKVFGEAGYDVGKNWQKTRIH